MLGAGAREYAADRGTRASMIREHGGGLGRALTAGLANRAAWHGEAEVLGVRREGL
jgi:hypothetical protein